MPEIESKSQPHTCHKSTNYTLRLFRFFPTLWTFFTIFIPAFFCLFQSLKISFVSQWSLSSYRQIFQPAILKLFSQSIFLALAASLLAIAFSYPLALFLKSKSTKLHPSHHAWLLFFAFPFLGNALLRLHSLKYFLATEGPLNRFLQVIGLCRSPCTFLYQPASVVVALFFILFPLALVPIYLAIIKLPASYLEASKDLGGSPAQIFLRVTFPLTWQAAGESFMMVFMPALSLFYLSDIIGGGKVALIGSLIKEQAISMGDFSSACATGIWVLGVVQILKYGAKLIFNTLARLIPYHEWLMTPKKRQGSVALRAWRWIPIVLILTLAYGSLFNSLIQSFFWKGHPSFKNYLLVFQDLTLRRAALNSLMLASCVSLTSTFLGFLIAVSRVMQPKNTKGQGFNNALSHPLMGAPDIVLAIAWLGCFSAFGIPLGMLSLWIAHTTFCLPFVIKIFESQLTQFDFKVIEAARDLGATELTIFLEILAPTLRPSIHLSMLIAFFFSCEDLIISEFLTSSTFQTLPIALEKALKLEPASLNHALSFILTLTPLPIFWLLTQLSWVAPISASIQRWAQWRKRVQKRWPRLSSPWGKNLMRLTPLFFILPLGAHHWIKNRDRLPRRRLVIFSLPGYFSETLIQNFQKKHDAFVDLHLFSSSEELLSRLVSHPEGACDLILNSGHTLGSLIQRECLQTWQDLKTHEDLFDRIQTPFLDNPYDPKTQHFIPYIWGITGLANDRQRCPNPPRSWADLLALEEKSRLFLVDDPKEIDAAICMMAPDPIANALHREKTLALTKRADLFGQENLQSFFASGEADVGMMWSSAFLRGKEEQLALNFIWPVEGVVVWLEGFMLSKSSKEIELAYDFLTHCFEAEEAKASMQRSKFSVISRKASTWAEDESLEVRALLDPNLKLFHHPFVWLKSAENSTFQQRMLEIQWMKWGLQKRSED